MNNKKRCPWFDVAEGDKEKEMNNPESDVLTFDKSQEIPGNCFRCDGYGRYVNGAGKEKTCELYDSLNNPLQIRQSGIMPQGSQRLKELSEKTDCLYRENERIKLLLEQIRRR